MAAKKRSRGKKKRDQLTRRSKREPNEFELLVARGISRLIDLGDAALQVVEEDPRRAVNAVIGALEGAGKVKDFVKTNPSEARAAAASLAYQGVEKLSNALIAASARQLRRDLNGKRGAR